MRLLLLLPHFLLLFLPTSSAITTTVSPHRMNIALPTDSRPTFFARTLPETLRVSGTCGADCNTVRQMHTATCRNAGRTRLFVAWAAHTGWVPNAADPTKQDETSAGMITEYQIDKAGKANIVSTTEYAECNDMGAVTAAPDCSVVAVLCRSSLLPTDFKTTGTGTALDFVKATEDKFGKQYGWSQASYTDAASAKCERRETRQCAWYVVCGVCCEMG